MDGWLRKKSHHIGVWKYRFFHFDGRALRYWKSERQARAQRSPRGEIALTGCHVMASQGCRFLIRAPLRDYDEELEAGTCEERDAWVCGLNAAALQQRILLSTCQVSPERFLRAKGIWQSLEEAAAACAGIGPSNGGVEDAVSVGELVLRHVRYSGAFLQLSEEPIEPRQGRLVVAGRRMLRGLRESGGLGPGFGKGGAPSNGAGSECWLLLLSSRVVSDEPTPQVLGAGGLLEEPRDSPLSFEVLHAFSDPLDGSGPFESLPLLHCEVGDVVRCQYGSGWSLRIYEVDDETGIELSTGHSWTITLETRDESESWRRAAKAARWAARARANGRRRAAEEALAAFDASPADWCEAASRRLKEVAADAPPPPTLSTASRMRAWASPRQSKLQIPLGRMAGPPAVGTGSLATGGSSSSTAPPPQAAAASEALRRVLAACEDVCGEAEGLLEAALARRPLRQDAAGAALRSALVPALTTAGRCWARWSGDLPHGEARVLLRWLEARRRTARTLGVVCPPLNSALSGLAAELSLRMGDHLRRLAEELLVWELGARLRQGPSGPTRALYSASGSESMASVPSLASTSTSVASSSLRALVAEQTASTLPVDLFTFINSCLLLDRDQGVPELRFCTLRVAKFAIKEVQEGLWGWLLATLPEVPRDWRQRPGAADALPTLVRRWLWGVASLANAMPSFRMHCEELAVAPLGEEESEEEDCSFLGSITDGEDASNNAGCSHARYGMHLPDLGSGRLPREWAFDDEAKGFESLLEAFLWAASDVVSAKWRQHALGAEQTEGRCVPTSLVGALLPQHLDPSVQHLRGWLDAALFQRFLTKLFLVCVGTYVVKLSRGTWLQGPGDPQMQLHKLSEEAICLSDYFAGLSLKTNGRITGAASSCLWEPGRVLNVLHAVLASPGGRYDKWKPRSPILRPSQLQSLDWKGPLSFEDSLSKLVSVLSEGALPIRDVLAWLSDGVPCQNFQELPTPLPAGGAYLMPRDKETQGSRRTSSASINLAQVSLLPRRRLSSGSNVVSAQDRAESQTSSTPSRDPSQRRMSGGRFSFFGQAPRQQTQVAQAHLQATRSPADSLVVSMAEEAASLAAEATSLAVRNSGALGLAAEGALCELRVEQVGAYGAFCTVSVSLEGSQQLDPARQRNAAPSGDASFSQPRRRKLRPLRRWAQLVKALWGRSRGVLIQTLSCSLFRSGAGLCK
ncbi:unnamed protein product [Polarella glacialis]|uniref:PH domain-containing protein n=1 Tax=Polarella glacialis TaxID=89957 RepID=A0A813HKK9_POLGL|nr:unnamed protein product [Polarella glacialis]